MSKLKNYGKKPEMLDLRLCFGCTQEIVENPITVEYRKHVSRRSGICKKCSKSGGISSEGYCLECYPDTKVNYCQDCFENFAKKNSKCIECGKRSDRLNGEQICLKCVSLYPPATTCLNCKSKFESKDSETLCEYCRPMCNGCGESFNPVNKSELFCKNCQAWQKESICPKCETKENLTLFGLCGTCLGDTRTFICEKCDNQQVVNEGDLCRDCSKSWVQCPRCEENKMLVDDFLCDQCLSKTQYDSSRTSADSPRSFPRK